MGNPAKTERETPVSLEALKPRRKPTETELSETNQVIAVALYTLQRERARADQLYQRARGSLTLSTTLFGLVQGAFLATISGKIGKDFLITPHERGDIALVAGTALGLLVIGMVVLQFVADRALSYRAIGHEDLLDALTGTSPLTLTAGQFLVAQLVNEEEQWETANRKRSCRTTVLAVISAASAAASIIELLLLFKALT